MLQKQQLKCSNRSNARCSLTGSQAAEYAFSTRNLVCVSSTGYSVRNTAADRVSKGVDELKLS